MLRFKTIRSPITGVVMERLMHPGVVAEAGVGRKPVLKIAEIDTLHVEVILPVEAFGKVQLGSKAEVVPDSPIGGRYEAVVKVVDRVFDAASGRTNSASCPRACAARRSFRVWAMKSWHARALHRRSHRSGPRRQRRSEATRKTARAIGRRDGADRPRVIAASCGVR